MELPNNADAQNIYFTKTVYIFIAVSLAMLELFIPRIPLFPWIKPGLANSITMLWIIRFGGRDALLFTLMRILITGFYFGFSFVTLALSVCGGVFATIAMGIVFEVLGKRGLIGVVGMAIIGAMVHNVGQVCAVYFLLDRNAAVWYQAPIMVLAALCFGGICAGVYLLVSRIPLQIQGDFVAVPQPSRASPQRREVVFTLGIIVVCVALSLVPRLDILSIILVAIMLFIWWIEKATMQTFFAPIRKFWLFFVCVGVASLFFTYGKVLPYVTFVTYEGVHETALQWVRLYCWLLLSILFKKAGFHTVMLSLLSTLFRSYPSTLHAGLYALEKFPSFIAHMKMEPRVGVLEMLKHPQITIDSTVHAALDIVNKMVVKEQP